MIAGLHTPHVGLLPLPGQLGVSRTDLRRRQNPDQQQQLQALIEVYSWSELSCHPRETYF